VSDKAVDNIQERFGLSATARDVIRNKLTGPSAKGAPALLVLGTTKGRYEQHIFNTLGPIELWALSTSSEDVAIRGRLYEKIGASAARIVLAATYPGGSARDDIRRRVLANSEDGKSRSAAISAVIDSIVEELISVYRQHSQQQLDGLADELADANANAAEETNPAPQDDRTQDSS
jgi:intracellular multiplication protein IcmB